MFKKIILALLCTVPLMAGAQNVVPAEQMVAITPMLSAKVDLPSSAKTLLAQKLAQIATQNGFGGVSGQVVLTANVAYTDKQVIASAPAKCIVDANVSFFVLDLASGVVIDEYTMAVQGVDKSEDKAIVNAMSSINPKDPSMRNFMAQSRAKLIDFYTTNIPSIINKAKSLEKAGKPREAMALLGSVPTFVNEYSVVAQQMQEIGERMPKETEKESATRTVAEKMLRGRLNSWYIDRFASAN